METVEDSAGGQEIQGAAALVGGKQKTPDDMVRSTYPSLGPEEMETVGG